MIVRKQSVRFDGNRVPVPRSVRVGYEGDHLVERLIFEVPKIGEEQSVFLVTDGEYADVVQLEQDADGRYAVDLTADMLGEGGAVDCWVQVRGADGAVWNSGVLRMRVGELPDADGDLIDREPTIVEQVTQAAQRAEQAARPKDDAVSEESVWSSAATVERMCPPFEMNGDEVRCHPAAGSVLRVVGQITAVQAGEGNPAPDNVRPISGHDAAVLTVNDAEYAVPFGQTVYGGTYDWESGMLTVTHRLIVLDGSADEGLYKWRMDDIGVFRARGITDAAEEPTYTSRQTVLAADRLAIGSHGQVYGGNIDFSVGGIKGAQTLAFYGNASITTAEQWCAWLAENPVTVVYKLAAPYEVQLTGTVITAAADENVLTSPTGGITVNGRSDAAWVMTELAARVAALEAAVVNGN